MKKLNAILMTAAMTLSLCACGSNSTGPDNTAANTNASAAETTAEAAGSGELEDFDIVLDWYPNAVHSFIYVAMDKGYYAEEGLNVNIRFPANTNDAITMPAAGKADAGLYYQPNIVSTASNQDVPIKVLGTIVRHPLNVVLYLKDSGITCAKDLVGKTIGTAGTGESEYFVKAMMEYNNASYDDVTLLDVGFDLNSALITKNVDAVIGAYINHEYPTLLKEGYDVGYIDISKEGVPDYEELVLITGQEQAEKESDKLARFLRASKKGFEYTAEHPDEALQILLDNQDASNYPLDPDIEKASMDILLPFMTDDNYSFLQVNKESWQNMADWLMEQGMIDKPVDIQTLFTDITE